MKGLNLAGAPISTKRARQDVQTALEVLEEIQERVRKMGIMPIAQPDEEARSLGSIKVGDLSNRELESYFTTYVAYAAFVSTKVAEAEASYKIAVANLGRIAANIKVNLYKENVAKAEIPARVKDSPEYREYELELLKLFAVKEILDAYRKAYAEQAQALSRSIEIRKLEFEQEHRTHNTSNHRAGDRPSRGLPGQLGRDRR